MQETFNGLPFSLSPPPTPQSASGQNTPNVPAGFWQAFAERARRTVPTLIDSLVPIYASHFSTAELTQLKAFYESPLGRRLVSEQGPSQQESARLGMRWGARIGSEVAMELVDDKLTEPKTKQP